MPSGGALLEVCRLCAVLEGIRRFSASYPEGGDVHSKILESLEEIFRYSMHWQGLGGAENEAVWSEWQADFRRAWDPFGPEGAPADAAAASSRRLASAGSLAGASCPEGCLRRAAVLHEEPLMAVFPTFVSPEECAGLIEIGMRICRPHGDWANERSKPCGHAGPLRGVACASLDPRALESEERRFVEGIQRRAAQLTGIEIHPDELLPLIKFDRPSEEVSAETEFELGLHLDVNSGFAHRACTLMVYLNSCERGSTVFPCAGDAESGALGARLASSGATHTNSKAVVSRGLQSASVELIRRAAEEPSSLRVAPQRGKACLFFNLLGSPGAAGDAPAPDPLSWHGGGAVAGAVGKWTLQFFKEVPMEHRGVPREAAYVAALRRRLLSATAAPVAEAPPPTRLAELD